MPDDYRIVISSELALSPDEVARRTFSTTFRGYEGGEVRAFLRRVADELSGSRERERELRRALESAEARASHPVLDEATLTSALGEETARVLRGAREAATEIVGRAEQKVARVLREAQDEADRLRTEAQAVLSRQTVEAEELTASVRQAAESDAEAVRALAHAEAEAEIEAARRRGREMVVEAQAVRERVLGDMARRRRLGQTQVEQLRAGRERLIEAYRVVRRTLDEVTEELAVAEAEARLAAEAAGRRAADEELAQPEPEPQPEPDGGPEPLTPEAEVAGRPEVVAAAEAGAPAEAPAEEDAGEAEGRDEVMAEAAASSNGDAGSGSIVLERRPKARLFRRSHEGETVVELDVAEPPAADEAVRVLGPEPDTVIDLTDAEDGPPAGPRAETEDVEQPEIAVAVQSQEPPEPPGPDPDEGALQQRDAALEPLDASLARKLKRMLQDEQNSALDALRTKRGRPALSALLPERSEQVDRYRQACVEVLQQAVATGVRFAGGPDNAREVDIDDLAESVASDAVDPLRHRLERALADAAEAAADETDLVDRIGAAYRETKGRHVERVSRDHVTAAFARGAFAAMPDGAALRWVVDDDGGPCPDCDDDALAGALPKGEVFPTGQCHPPAHAGCRCLLVRVPS